MSECCEICDDDGKCGICHLSGEPHIPDLRAALDSLPRELRDRMPHNLEDIMEHLSCRHGLFEQDLSNALQLFIQWTIAKEREGEALKQLYNDLVNRTPPRVPTVPHPLEGVLLEPPVMMGVDFGLGESQSVSRLHRQGEHIPVVVVNLHPDAPHKRKGKSTWNDTIQGMQRDGLI